MTHRWPLPSETVDLARLPRMETKQVLIAHGDEPYLVLSSCGSSLALALVAETHWERKIRRWVIAKLPLRVWDELLHGRLAIRDAFLERREVLVMDRNPYPPERRLRAWWVEPGDVPDAVWPEPDKRLPMDVRRQMLEAA